MVLACKPFDALIGATFVNTGEPAVFLEWKDNKHTLILQPSGSGARYEVKYDDGAISLFTKGDSALLKINRQPDITCKIETPG